MAITKMQHCTLVSKSHEIYNKTIWFIQSQSFQVVIIAIGAILRLSTYAKNSSLGGDQIAVALNIINRPLHMLLTAPLDGNQVAPRGFLFIEKFAVAMLGNNDYALRLFPLICSFFSLALFWRLARKLLSGSTVTFAVAIFAFSITLISYGIQVKQYSSDIAVSLLMTILALNWLEHQTARRGLLLGIIGGLCVWFSQASVLVLAGLGLAITVSAVFNSNRTALSGILPLALLWGIAAIAAIIVGFNSMTQATREYMYIFWHKGFMPMPPNSINDVLWTWQAFKGIFYFLRYPGPATVYVVAMTVGFWSLWKRRRETVLFIFLPLVVALGASAAHQFPFRGRIALFLVPTLLIALSDGFDFIRREWLQSVPSRIVALGQTVLVLFLACHAIFICLWQPGWGSGEGINKVIGYVQAHHSKTDRVYVYYGGRGAFKYYGPQYSFLQNPDVVIGQCHRGQTRDYLRELDLFRGDPRVWVLFDHIMFKEDTAILSYLDQIGIRLDSIQSGPSIGYIYDLSDRERLASSSADTHPLPERLETPRIPKGFRCSDKGRDPSKTTHK